MRHGSDGAPADPAASHPAGSDLPPDVGFCAIVPFLVGTTSIGVIVTALFNDTRGSILWPALFHFQLNNPLWPDAQPYDSALLLAAAIAVVWVWREVMFDRAGAVTGVIPGAVAAA